MSREVPNSSIDLRDRLAADVEEFLRGGGTIDTVQGFVGVAPRPAHKEPKRSKAGKRPVAKRAGRPPGQRHLSVETQVRLLEALNRHFVADYALLSPEAGVCPNTVRRYLDFFVDLGWVAGTVIPSTKKRVWGLTARFYEELERVRRPGTPLGELRLRQPTDDELAAINERLKGRVRFSRNL